MRRFKGRLILSLSLLASSLLLVDFVPSASASAPPPNTSAMQQIIAANNSPSGVQVRAGMASLLTDPALPQAAQALLQSYGPAGSNALTPFQVDLLNALVTATKDPSLLSAMLTGHAVSGLAVVEGLRLRLQLQGNPAVRALISAGFQLRHSSELTADISAGAAGSLVTYSTLTPAPTAGQGGSAAMDQVISDFASLRTSSAYNTYANQLSSVSSDPGFRELMDAQPPITLLGLLPTSELAALSLPTGRYANQIFTMSLLAALGTFLWDIVGPLAVFAIGLYFLPVELPTGLALAALMFATYLGAIYTGQQVGDGIIKPKFR